MDHDGITALRLINQGIAHPTAVNPAEAVARLGAMQAQDAAAIRWAIGLRCREATLATVEAALASGDVIRTWLLRGTLHVVAASDVRWMLALLAPRILAGGAGRRRQLGLDDATLERSLDTIAGALESGAVATRSELLQVLERAGIATTGQRGYHLLGHAALRGLICFGPPQGKQESFVLLDTRAPAPATLDRDSARGELARRYFTGHGPATLADFVWWSGLPLGEARAALDQAKADLDPLVMGDQTYYQASAAPAHEDARASGVVLLPAFDEYYLGYAARGAILEAGLDKRVVSSNGIFRPMIVVDGQVTGIWRTERKPDGTRLLPTLFRPLSAQEAQGLQAAVERFAAFRGEANQLA